MSSKLPFLGSGSKPVAQDAKKEPDKEELGSILNFSERSDLVVLIEAIASDIVKNVNSTFDGASLTESGEAPKEKQRGETVYVPGPEIRALHNSMRKWYDKWRDIVLRRVCEAANTRWEPVGQSETKSEPKDLDELSWNDEAPEHTAPDTSTADENLQRIYPPISSSLYYQNRDKRLLVLHSMLLILLSLKHYYAPSRILLLRLASSLNLTLADVDTDEEKTAKSLVSGAKALSANEEVERKAKENQSSRSWKVFGASLAGAAVIGLTGGLAAPLVAAGIGTVMGGLGLGATAAAGLLGSLAGSSVLVGGLFGAYGARMTGQMMDQYAQEISDFAFVPLRGKAHSTEHPSEEEEVKEVDPDERRLRVTIGISGWLTEKSDVYEPWEVLGPGAEVFALRWELECLQNLGTGLRELITSAAWNFARVEVLKLTVFSTLLGAVALPLGLLNLGKLVDNPVRLAKSRADKAGEVLADALINRAQGERPVALVGYSMGARLIYACLLALAKRRAFGLVDSVVLFGAPVPSSDSAWHIVRSVVAGRAINVHSANDYVLGFLYRANSVQIGVAGLQKINVPRVENVDLSDTVTSHFQYQYVLGRVLKDVGWEDLDGDALERQEKAFQLLQQQEREIKEILEDEQADPEGRKKLKEEMSTEVPVEAGTPEEERLPPSLPPRRPTGGSNVALQSSQDNKSGLDTEKDPPAGVESGKIGQEKDKQTRRQAKQPMRTFEYTLHEDDEDNDEHENEHRFSGIQMVDND